MRPIAGSTLIAISLAVAGVSHADVGEPTTVIDAEYAFAHSAKPLGVRGAFLKWLAPDSIICSPGPANGITATAADEPNGDVLEWYPALSHTAGSGDLGYTTGPWKFRSADGKAAAQGTFLSVWRRQPDHAWRVVLDCGVTHPKPEVVPAPLSSPLPAAPSKGSATAGWREPIGTAEARFTAAASTDAREALKTFGAADVRVMARGVPVAVGVDAGEALLATQKLGTVWGHAFAAQSSDGTLGYAWGYIGNAQSEAPTAAYVNVWRRANDAAPWKIVAQSLQLMPPPKKD